MLRIKHVDYQDEDGRMWRVQVPDDCLPENYHSGIRLGPPFITDELWDSAFEVRLQNALHSRGIFTERQFRARLRDVNAALNAARRSDVQRLHRLYLEDN